MNHVASRSSSNNKRGTTELFAETQTTGHVSGEGSKAASRVSRGTSSSDEDDSATTTTSSSTSKSSVRHRHKKVRRDEETPLHAGPIQSVMGWNLFVTGVPLDVRSEELQEYFGQHGQVQSVRIIPTTSTSSTTSSQQGCRPAIVEFASKMDAQNAINECHDRAFRSGAVLGVSWAFVQPPPFSLIGFHIQ